MTGGETLSDGPHQQAEDRTGWTSHLPLTRYGALYFHIGAALPVSSGMS